MKNKRFARIFTALLCAVLVVMVFPITASADTGPKPSVRITFENLGEELCYGTLLSSRESTGPASAWNGNEEDARHNENPNGQYDWQNFGYDVWKAFVDYAENDDFYFLQEAWQVNITKELAWTYYPPEEFKILLYFPESGEYAVSDVYESYAFDSYFTVNMDGATLFAHYNEDLSSDERINAHKSYNYGVEIMRTLGIEPRVIRAGKANMMLSPLFRQTLATLTGARIELFDTDGALGAARGAALGAGIYTSREECFGELRLLEVVEPCDEWREKLTEGYKRWKKIVENKINEK